MSQPNQANFTLVAGENRPLVVTIVNAAGTAVNITGWALAFYAHAQGASPFVTKTTGAGGIVLTDPTAGEATIYLVPADTASQAPGNYTYSVWRTDTGFAADVLLGSMILLGS